MWLSHEIPLPRIEQALSSLNDVVIITEAEPFDLPGPRIVYVNSAFERMTGFSASEVIGRTPRLLHGPRTSRLELDRLRSAFERRESCRVAVTNYRKDGRPFDVEFDVVPVADEGSWVTHWVSVQRDTTQQTVAAKIIAGADSVDTLVSGVLRETVEYADVDGACWEIRESKTEAWQPSHCVWRDRAADTYTHGRQGIPRGIATAKLAIASLPLQGKSEARLVLWRLESGDIGHAAALAKAVAERCTMRYERLLAEATRDQLETRLRQAQKLESVGRLAGGVAHDFNNLLTVIMGNLELLKDRIAPHDCGHGELDEVLRATKRAASLVRHLLAFSRQQPITMGELDLTVVIRETVVLLQRSLGSHITLHVDVPAGLPMVTGDAALLEQVLINLALNSRDAIQSAIAGSSLSATGSITIRLTDVTLHDGTDEDWTLLSQGRYVCLAFEDDGPGMSPTELARAFDPFFTTKPVGAGSGLGLSSVHGTVGRMGGVVRLDTGTAGGFLARIMLPVRESPSEPLRAPTP